MGTLPAIALCQDVLPHRAQRRRRNHLGVVWAQRLISGFKLKALLCPFQQSNFEFETGVLSRAGFSLHTSSTPTLVPMEAWIGIRNICRDVGVQVDI